VAYPPYRAGPGAGVLELDVAENSKLRDLLTLLARRSQEFEPLAGARSDEWLWGQLLVHVKGEMVRLDEQLHEGDCLELLPPIAGGALRNNAWLVDCPAALPAECRSQFPPEGFAPTLRT
jgi:molybdopterin converting factor small subunit